MTADEARNIQKIPNEDLIEKTNSSIRNAAKNGSSYINTDVMRWDIILKLKAHYKNAGFIVAAYKHKVPDAPYLEGHLNIRWEKPVDKS